MGVESSSQESAPSRYFGRAAMSGLLFLGACGSATGASTEQQAKRAATSSKRFAVAGISPGVAAADVATLAQRGGYILSRVDAGPDWKEQIERANGRQQTLFGPAMRGIREQEFRRGGERIWVQYLAMPIGPVVRSISYSAPPAILNFQQAVAEMTRRYGRQSFGNSVIKGPWAQWCAKPARTARECLTSTTLSVTQDNGGVGIRADDPALAEQQAKLLRETAGSRPSF